MPTAHLEGFTHRAAMAADEADIAALMDYSIAALLAPFLTQKQVEASRTIMGLDRQLIGDGTYFAVHEASTGKLAACGGWSKRTTLYGGDHSTDQRNAALLRIGTDAARIRAMYTHPDFARRGLGRYVLALCEESARKAGFTRAELMATMAGEPLYRACGYKDIERIVSASVNGVDVPGLRMEKTL